MFEIFIEQKGEEDIDELPNKVLIFAIRHRKNAYE